MLKGVKLWKNISIVEIIFIHVNNNKHYKSNYSFESNIFLKGILHKSLLNILRSNILIKYFIPSLKAINFKA